MVQQALKNIPPEKRAEHEERLRDSYKKHLTAAPKIQQKAAPGMQLAVASSVTGSLIPKKTDTFMEAVGEALSILKEGHTVSTPLLQAAFEKIKAFADTDALSAAISSVSAPSNPTVGKVPGLSARGFVCPETGNFVDELEINDYPQVARYKLTQKVRPRGCSRGLTRGERRSLGCLDLGESSTEVFAGADGAHNGADGGGLVREGPARGSGVETPNAPRSGREASLRGDHRPNPHTSATREKRSLRVGGVHCTKVS